MDRFDLAEHGGSFAAALRAVTSESVLVLGVESDMLFPIDEQAAIAEAFERNAVPTRFARLPSLEGHDAFLVDIPRFQRRDPQLPGGVTGVTAAAGAAVFMSNLLVKRIIGTTIPYVQRTICSRYGMVRSSHDATEATTRI
jgi:hypothetical protein